LGTALAIAGIKLLAALNPKRKHPYSCHHDRQLVVYSTSTMPTVLNYPIFLRLSNIKFVILLVLLDYSTMMDESVATFTLNFPMEFFYSEMG